MKFKSISLSAALVTCVLAAAGAAQQAPTGTTPPPKGDGGKTAPAKLTPVKEAPQQKKAETSLKVGDKAPALAVDEWIKGDSVKSFEKGKVYVVEFWATWCGPCIKSIPHLTELQTKYKDSVVVIGMASSEAPPQPGQADKRVENLKSFVKKQGEKMEYRVAYDAKRTMSNTWMQPAGQNGIPCAFIVDRDGKLAYIGHPSQMDGALETAAGKPDAAKPKPKS